MVRDESGARVLACEREAQTARAGVDKGGSRRHVLYGCALAVGAAFLAATLAGGLLLPAAHRALHWRCQTQYVASLLLGDILLVVTQLAGDSIQTETPVCYALGQYDGSAFAYTAPPGRMHADRDFGSPAHVLYNN
ncbi:Probable G-protein coupled receptor Mth-like 1 [Eumeta japonica]|uniref:Probable G-protein coupled receptor Mth-like 1 n=1 Tax=Eumeta variegata TaxID=151549 RepID=A0A4C1ZPG0_EUMVA|nr:Probable G-protein coupled receptor Mth-like 1 [Eumeta japonica]